MQLSPEQIIMESVESSEKSTKFIDCTDDSDQEGEDVYLEGPGG